MACSLVDFIKSCDMMWKQSVWTSCIAAELAAKHLKDGGLLTLTGAHPAQKGRQVLGIEYIVVSSYY